MVENLLAQSVELFTSMSEPKPSEDEVNITTQRAKQQKKAIGQKGCQDGSVGLETVVANRVQNYLNMRKEYLGDISQVSNLNSPREFFSAQDHSTNSWRLAHQGLYKPEIEA
jgi:hypothetical protein